MLRLRVRSPDGKQHTVSTPTGSSLGAFLAEARRVSNLPASAQVELLCGFPPKTCTAPLDSDVGAVLPDGSTAVLRLRGGTAGAGTSAPKSQAGSAPIVAGGGDWSCPRCTLRNEASLSSCGACGGDKPGGRSAAAAAASSSSSFSSTHTTATSSAAGSANKKFSNASIHKVPDDNSCLFHAISYTLEPSTPAMALRKRVADTVTGDPEQWNDAVLGKSPAEYIAFIQNPIRWGGQVELAILSAAFKAEIAVTDVKTGRCDVYGEGSGYKKRVYLTYTGIHFDAVEFGAAKETVVIPPSDAAAREAVRRLVQREKSDGKFVDQQTMRLRCKICGFIANGDYEARAHAGGMGHKEFVPA